MYIDTNTDRYPLYPGDIIREVEGWSMGDALPSGWYAVTPSELPEISANETYTELAPIQVDGIYTQQWGTRDLTAEELERVMAPMTARQKLKDAAGLTDIEIDALIRGLR